MECVCSCMNECLQFDGHAMHVIATVLGLYNIAPASNYIIVIIITHTYIACC